MNRYQRKETQDGKEIQAIKGKSKGWDDLSDLHYLKNLFDPLKSGSLNWCC